VTAAAAGGSALHRGIVRVVLLYAAFTAGWILLSDKAMEWLVRDPSLLPLAGTFKGWLFAVGSSLLLYAGLRRLAGAAADPAVAGEPRIPKFTLALITAAVVLVAGFAIQRATRHRLEMGTARLEAVAEASVGRLSDWLRERRGDAEFIRTSTYFADLYRQWREAASGSAAERLQARLEELRQAHGFHGVVLLTPDGEPLWTSAGAFAELEPELGSAVQAARRTHRIQWAGPYWDRGGHARLDLAVPVSAAESHPVVVLQTESAAWLKPTETDRQLPGSGSTIRLFRRDGDRIRLFAPEGLGREREIPASRWPWAAELQGSSQVAWNEPGGAAVGVVRPVPATDWMLLASLDRSELYGEAIKDAVWIALAGILLLFAASVVLLLQRQRQQLAIAEAVRLSQGERLRALQLLAAIADASEDAIFAKDRDGRYLLFNRAAGRVVGKSPEQVLGQDDRSLFPAPQARTLMELDRRILAENRIVTQEETLDTACGIRTFLAVKGPLLDEAGQLLGTYGISRDVTARKEAEQALRRQVELNQRYLDTVQTLIVALDRTGKLTMINRAGLDMLGYREEELIGRDWFATCLPQPEGLEVVYPAFLGLMAGDIGAVKHFQDRVRCHDGRLRLIAWHNAYLTDETGALIGTLSSGQDITEFNEVQQQLKISEERLRLALQASRDGLWDWDLTTGLAYLAPRYYEMTGYRPEEVVPDLEFFERTIHPDDRERVLAVLQAHLQGVTSTSEFDYRLVTAAGEVRWMRGLGRVVERDAGGAPLRMVGIITDISGRKAVEEELRRQTEELARRNAELERFNRAMVGRELDMISLKRQVNELSRQLGREPPFALALLESGSERGEGA
jgi:PAS domain S-box-containing protein